MIDTFDITDFQKFVDTLGYENTKKFNLGEWVWLLKIDNKSQISIRSSIGKNGVSSYEGKNSIRLRLQTLQGDFIMRTDDAWTNRKLGWKIRIKEKITALVGWRVLAGDCETCGKPKSIYLSKTSDNPDRRFAKCYLHGHFTWLD